MTDSRQPAAILTMTRGPEPGRRFAIGAAPVTIGRGAVNDVQVPGTWVSRQHARITWTGTGYVVEDMGSTNGTFVNGQRAGGPLALKSGDLVQLGTQVELAFEARMPASHPARPVPQGIAPSPASSAGPPPPYAPPAQPASVPKESLPRRKRARVWVLAGLGLILVLAIAAVAYFLLSDNGEKLADIPILEAILPEPTATLTPTPIPPTPTPTATPVPPTATPKPEPLVIKGEAFEATSNSTCSADVAIVDVIDDGLRIQVLGGTLPIRQGRFTIWCYGAKHTWMGKLTYGEYTFDSDEDNPLQFTLDSRKGYTYLAGKGNVVQPDGKTVELP